MHVLSHDGKPHRVVRVISRQYKGLMIGIRHDCAERLLWLTADHRVLTELRPRSLGGRADWSAVPPENFKRARAMRRGMTPPERKLWQAIRGESLGVKFRRQHPIGPYIADFYSRDAWLVVEVDGAAAHCSAEASAYDRERDAYMSSLGLRVMRFAASDVSQRLDGVLEALSAVCAQRTADEGLDWVQAQALRAGDTVFFGPGLEPARITEVRHERGDEEVYDLEVEHAHSYLTDVCAVHNCGCGTAVVVAHKLKRKWIGIDITHLATNLIKTRLDDTFGEKVRKTYVVVGEPVTVYDAEQLAKDDPWQFQLWALSLIPHAWPSDKKGADRGIDGKLFFHDEDVKGGRTKQIIFSVKAGHVESSHVRDLRGVVEREGAQIGVLVSFNEPTQPMWTEAASAGFYESPWGKHPRIQLITVGELLEGKRIDFPYTRGVAKTFKQAPKHVESDGAEQTDLEFEDEGESF